MTDGSTRQPIILVPLDASPLARLALIPAFELARRLDARVLLLSVQAAAGHDAQWLHREAQDEAEADSSAGAMPEEHRSRESAAEYLESVRREADAAGIASEALLVEGRPAAAIVETAAAMGVELIAMSTHGRRGPSRWALGSVAGKVLDTSTRPVLLIRAGAGHVEPRIRHVAVALDGSDLAEAVLPQAQRLASAFGAVVTLLHVIVEPRALSSTPAVRAAREHHSASMNRYLASVAARLVDVETDAECLSGKDVAATLIDRLEQGDIGLLAMTTHGRGGVARWAMGSVADRLVRASPTFVLVQRVAG